MKITKTQLKQIIKEELEKIFDPDLTEVNYDTRSRSRQKLVDAIKAAGTAPSAWRRRLELAYFDKIIKLLSADNFNSGDFDQALEEFEVDFNLRFPDSIKKLQGIFQRLELKKAEGRLTNLYSQELLQQELGQ